MLFSSSIDDDDGNPIPIGIAGQHILNGTVFSEPESDLTCNASGSRKRTRENQMVATLKTHQLHYQHQLLPTPSPPNLPAAPTATAATSASPLHMFPELPNNRLHDDGAGTSASGTSSLSSIPQQLYSYLCTHNLDLDTFIRHQVAAPSHKLLPNFTTLCFHLSAECRFGGGDGLFQFLYVY